MQMLPDGVELDPLFVAQILLLQEDGWTELVLGRNGLAGVPPEGHPLRPFVDLGGVKARAGSNDYCHSSERLNLVLERLLAEWRET